MFTGLIDRIGTIERVEVRGAGATLLVSHEPWDDDLAIGESVAVQGVCLTVTDVGPGQFGCDVLLETLRRSTLGARGRGGTVNLERALRAADRFGGHFVSGHVDGVASVEKVEAAGEDHVLRMACGAELRRGIVEKGSVGCDGVSLTVSALSEAGFGVHVIPQTWAATTLSELSVGDGVNVELDMLGKYVQRALSGSLPEGAPVTLELLQKSGFLG